MEIKNAIIERASLSIEEHGFLTCYLTLDYGGSGQGFGGYVLALPRSSHNFRRETTGAWHIMRIMEIAGVNNWFDLVGKTIRAKATLTKVSAIGHIIKDDWFSPEEEK